MTNQAKKNKPHSEAKSKILALIQKDNDVSLTDIMHFAESMAHSMDSYFGSIDKAIYREFCEIGEAIANMRMEIEQLQA
ncbi:MAG: hypothetical protein K8F25_17065, partial [Fimbriimonadaceae bacterium]|nr:hypothetical protein [Alphaproteobacteria bacterium]